jgi:branched-subunit amino acid transport protein
VSDTWITIAVLAVTGAMIRASGPLLMGGRRLPERLTGVVDLLAPALLAALIVVGTLSEGRAIGLSASIAGVAAAGIVLLRRREALLTAILVAAAVTALLRALA